MSEHGREVSMKTGIILLISALILLVAMMKAGTESPDANKPDTTNPEVKQQKPEADNTPIFENDYEKAVSHNDRNVLIIFGADWCKYCKILKEDMPSMNLNGYVVCVVDVTKNKEAKIKSGISSLPTSVVMEGGKEVARSVGYSKEQYKEWLEANRRLAK